MVIRNNSEETFHGGPQVSPTSARRLHLAGAPSSWVLSGQGELCLLRSAPATGAGPGDLLNCVRPAAAAQGYLMSAYSVGPGATGEALVEGLVPDGAREVRLSPAAGRARRVKLADGAYLVRTVGEGTVTFELDGRHYAVPVPQAPRPALIGPR